MFDVPKSCKSHFRHMVLQIDLCAGVQGPPSDEKNLGI